RRTRPARQVTTCRRCAGAAVRPLLQSGQNGAAKQPHPLRSLDSSRQKIHQRALACAGANRYSSVYRYSSDKGIPCCGSCDALPEVRGSDFQGIDYSRKELLMFTSSSLHKLAATVTVGAFAVALTACGGGGGGSDAVASSGSSGASYSGSTSAAVVSDANKDQAARASIEGTTAAVEADGVDSLPVGVAAVVTDSSASAEPASPETIERVKAIVLQMAEQQGVTGEMVSGVTMEGECGGSFTIGGDGTTTKITYNNYCIDDGEGQITISGKVIVKTLGEDSTQITYQNMVVTSGGVTERL